MEASPGGDGRTVFGCEDPPHPPCEECPLVGDCNGALLEELGWLRPGDGPLGCPGIWR